MKLTAPLHNLRGQAKRLKKAQSITMAEALNQVAQAEGFDTWSLLQAKVKAFMPKTAKDILDYLHAGDMLLIGARPGLGKTILTLEVLLQAVREGRQSFFFSLDYTQNAVTKKILGIDPAFDLGNPLLRVDLSEEISSGYIINQTKNSMTEGSLIAIDYLQLLDQSREKPPLQNQVESLKAYAKQRKSILIFISQIDRNFEEEGRMIPNIKDIRLPNPLDITLFNKSIFVHQGQIFL